MGFFLRVFFLGSFSGQYLQCLGHLTSTFHFPWHLPQLGNPTFSFAKECARFDAFMALRCMAFVFRLMVLGFLALGFKGFWFKGYGFRVLVLGLIGFGFRVGDMVLGFCFMILGLWFQVLLSWGLWS